jgi:hypothetical protein
MYQNPADGWQMASLIFSRIWLVLLLCCTVIATDLSHIMQAESLLTRELLKNYVSTVVPRVPGGVAVEVQIALANIDVNTREEEIEIAGWWRVYWQDPRLTWNASEWAGVDSLIFRDKQIWQPDVIIYEQTYDSYTPVGVSVTSDGAAFVSWPRKVRPAPFVVRACSH